MCPALESPDWVDTDAYHYRRLSESFLDAGFGGELQNALGVDHVTYSIAIPKDVYDKSFIDGQPTESSLAIFLYGGTGTDECPTQQDTKTLAVDAFESALFHFASNGVIAIAVVSPVNDSTSETRRAVFKGAVRFFIHWLGTADVEIARERVCFIGHSAGGKGAILAAADLVDEAVGCVVALAPAPLGEEVDLPGATSLLVLIGTHDDDPGARPNAGQSVYDATRTDAQKAKFYLRGITHGGLGPPPGSILDYDNYGDATAQTLGKPLRDALSLAFFKFVTTEQQQNLFSSLLWDPLTWIGPALTTSDQALIGPQFKLRAQTRNLLAPGETVSLFDPDALPDVGSLPAGFYYNSPCVAGAEAGALCQLFSGPELESIPVWGGGALAPGPGKALGPSCGKGVRFWWDRHQVGCQPGNEVAVVRYQLPSPLASYLPDSPPLDSVYLLIDLGLIVDADYNLINQSFLAQSWGTDVPVVPKWRPGCVLTSAATSGILPYTDYIKPVRGIEDHEGFNYALVVNETDYRVTQLTTAVYPVAALADAGSLASLSYLFLELTGGQEHARGDAFIGAIRLAWRW